MRTIASLFIAFAAFAQTPPAAGAGAAGPVALIRFQFEPKDARGLALLRPEDIEVREDGQARKVVALESGAGKQHEIPIDISILFDCDRLALSSGALSPRVFHEGLLDEFPNASITMYGFSPGLTRLVGPSRNEADLFKVLGEPLRVHPLSTLLMDSISRVIMESAADPSAAVRMVAIISPGQNDVGSISPDEIQRRYERAVAIARRANVSVFPSVLIGGLATQDSSRGGAGSLSTASRVPGPQLTIATGITPAMQQRAAGNYVSLASETGGKRVELVAGGNMLPTLLKWLADQIRSEYVAGFQVSPSNPQKQHTIEVVVKNKERGRISSGALRLVY